MAGMAHHMKDVQQRLKAHSDLEFRTMMISIEMQTMTLWQLARFEAEAAVQLELMNHLQKSVSEAREVAYRAADEGRRPATQTRAESSAVGGFATIRFGSTGCSVRNCQSLLNLRLPLHPLLVVDGQFGAATVDRVRKFQMTRQLAVDGIVGPETWAELR